jgi:tetratricopeptide (TPR) repeat protein
MSRTLVILFAFLITLLPLGVKDLYGAADPSGEHPAIESHDKEMKAEAEVRLKINTALLEAAEKIVSDGINGDKDGLKFLKMAVSAAAESRHHYETGEYAFALEDISESTRMANYAIILASSDNESIRDAVIKEAMLLGAEGEHERKEAMIRKSIAEAETFVRTAGRLLKESENPGARGELNEASGYLISSKQALAAERYDESLEYLDKAYRLATGSVRKIKMTQAEPITFPRPKTTDEGEILAYELKKNETYLFFAGEVVKSEEGKLGEMIKRARGMSNEASGAIKDDKKRLAIDKLRASTGLIVKALNSIVGE